jgi:hypothetical protein
VSFNTSFYPDISFNFQAHFTSFMTYGKLANKFRLFFDTRYSSAIIVKLGAFGGVKVLFLVGIEL